MLCSIRLCPEVQLVENRMLVQLKKAIRILGNLLLMMFLIVVFSGLVISNQQEVTVSLWSWSLSLELSFALFLSFWLGAGLTVLIGLFLIVRLNMRNNRLVRKLERREQELQKLRMGALRGLSS